TNCLKSQEEEDANEKSPE
ncbi:hypothetical protein NPIL_339901, partial [Nephila pilipes]